MQKQKLILIAGAALALIAVFMVKTYLDQQRQAITEKAKKALEKAQANQTAVLVAKNDIARGATIELDAVEVKITPNQFVQPQAVTSLDRISGMVTIAPISKGEQITLSKLVYTKQAGALSQVTPVGKRAITISVDNISSLAGMIKPGDYVDVICASPVPVQTQDGKQTTQVAVMPLFQNVLVLAVGQEISTQIEESRYKGKKDVAPSPLITLALTPHEANLLAFVQEQGKFRLILRSPADSKIEPAQPAGWEAVLQYVLPKEAFKRPKEEGPSVEIYRGLSKEKILLSK